uniref:Uncharacterized protein n=1 Tax=Alexandrium monilatum TaxID=311494 RepID=A0A7S4QLU3_9DINO
MSVDAADTCASEELMENFVNDSAKMIAYERALESGRPDALFQDPFAKAMAGQKGEKLSEAFGANCSYFGLDGWPEFHKMWTAVRTRFIDDRIAEHAATGRFPQLVNLGAGLDTRAYRLECYKSFANGSFEVDMETVNAGKAKVFRDCLGEPSPRCGQVHNVSLDFLDEERTLATELAALPAFEAGRPTVFVSEGLIMYLGAVGKLKLIRDVSAVAAPGSVLILQYLDSSESETGAQDHALSAEEATRALTEHGWEQLAFSRFGDERLNFGRFPTERFKPTCAFSFVVCVKSA